MTLWLIDATLDQRVALLTEGAMVPLSMLDTSLQFNIEAVVDGAASARFTWSGLLSGSAVENVEPFAMFGDTGGDFSGQTAAVGTLTVTAEGFSASDAGGTLLADDTLQFEFQRSGSLPDAMFADGFEAP